ncbi:hypothetical protein B0T13DRAFT_228188 [Neurospora crassa]|nr:hypothetical protein B0T13DRAFT_228188 [Neurospora crassa]
MERHIFFIVVFFSLSPRITTTYAFPHYYAAVDRYVGPFGTLWYGIQTLIESSQVGKWGKCPSSALLTSIYPLTGPDFFFQQFYIGPKKEASRSDVICPSSQSEHL